MARLPVWQFQCCEPGCGLFTVKCGDRSEWRWVDGIVEVVPQVVIDGQLYEVSHGFCPEHYALHMAEVREFARARQREAVRA